MPDGAMPVLDVKDLKTVFKTRSGEVHAVNSVSFDLKPGKARSMTVNTLWGR